MTITCSQTNSTSGSMCDERTTLTPLFAREVVHELEHFVAPLRVHAVRRLVEQEQIGIVHERLRQLDPLFHAGGVRLHVPVARLPEPDVEEHFVGALHRVGPRKPGELAAVRHERDRVHPGNVSVALGHVADAGADLRGAAAASRPSTRIRALGRREETEQRLEHRALAGAIRPEQADGAGGTTKETAWQRRVTAVGDRHVLEAAIAAGWPIT